jgi:hypothetical protein
MKRNWQIALVVGIVVAGAFYAASRFGINTRPYALGLSLVTAMVLILRWRQSE